MNQTRTESSIRFSWVMAPRSRRTTAADDARSTHRGSRDGYTLIHVLFVLTLMAMLLAISTSTLFTLIQAEREVRQQMLYHGTVSRLSRQLRDDVHAAGIADLGHAADGPEAADRLILHLPENSQIHYLIETDRIVRTTRKGQANQHRQSFETPSREAARWELRRINGHRVVSLLLPRKLDGATTGPSSDKTLRFTAVVGYDQRFLASSDQDREEDDG